MPLSTNVVLGILAPWAGRVVWLVYPLSRRAGLDVKVPASARPRARPRGSRAEVRIAALRPLRKWPAPPHTCAAITNAAWDENEETVVRIEAVRLLAPECEPRDDITKRLVLMAKLPDLAIAGKPPSGGSRLPRSRLWRNSILSRRRLSSIRSSRGTPSGRCCARPREPRLM